MTDLPWDDPSVDRLDAGAREDLARYWVERAGAEQRVAGVFALLASELEQTGVSVTVRVMLAAALEDEVRHSEICRRLAERYRGAPVAHPIATPARLPSFAGADRDLCNALRVAAMCCINETIATVWLKRCFRDARAPLARAAARLHLAEEIDHARLGWAHLASAQVGPAVRSAVAPWLVRLLSATVPQWFEADHAAPVEGHPAQGMPAVLTTREVVLDALRDVVLPGFAELGIDVARAQRWADGFARESCFSRS